MTGSWDSYYVVFLSALLSLTFPAVLAAVSFVLFGNKFRKKPGPAKELGTRGKNETVLGQRINVRFFLAANAALILFALALALIPCVTTLRADNDEGMGKGLAAIITLAGFSVLGLLYSIRKGDMSWLDSYDRKVE